MNTGKNIIPSLRFPEYKISIGWKESLIKDVCSIGTGKSNSQDQVEGGKYPFFIRSEVPVRSNRYLYDCEAVITIGDGKIGKVFHYINGKFDLHQRCYKMSDFKNVDGKFFYYYFSSHFYERAMRMTAKATVDSVRLGMISEMPISFPSISEQQKIAECLSSIDSYISSINEKVEQLKAHKKSLLQKLFPQNGKNVPEYRFSEFNNTKEWEIKKVGDIATTFSGGTPSISKKQYYGGDIPFIRSGEIKGTKTELSLTQLGVEKTSAKLVSAGTILYALYGATSGEVAISKISGAINQAILAIIVDNELCEVQFLYQILLANKEKILDKYLQGGQGNLSGSIITNLQILLPPLVEQSKIAGCLSSIDEAITLYSEKVSLIEQHKKGLMQQLFPTPK